MLQPTKRAAENEAELAFDTEDEVASTLKTGTKPFKSLVNYGSAEEPDWRIDVIGRLRRVRDTSGSVPAQLEFIPKLTEVQIADEEVEKAYPLGNFKGAHFIDHTPLLEPLLDQGWVVKKHEATRGGSKIATILSYPERTLEDIIKWDASQFEDSTTIRECHPGIMIRADAKRGSSYRATAGFFRQVCTNGLISSYLDVGHLKIRHGSMSADRVRAEIKELADVTQQMKSMNSFDEKFFPHEAAGWASHILSTYPAEERYPKFIEDFLVPIVRVLKTRDRISALGKEFELLYESGRPYTVLDMVNAATNVNQGFRTLYGLDSLAGGLIQMSEVGNYVWQAVHFTKKVAAPDPTNPDADDDFDEDDNPILAAAAA